VGDIAASNCILQKKGPLERASRMNGVRITTALLSIKTETAMSRQEADLIAVLIFTYDSTRLLIHSGGTAVRDKSLGRVPHENLLVAEQIQIIQQFWAEGSTLTRLTPMSVGSLLSFSIRTDRIVRDGKRVNHDVHSLFHRQHL
jgi:hypothetical protein